MLPVKIDCLKENNSMKWTTKKISLEPAKIICFLLKRKALIKNMSLPSVRGACKGLNVQ
jgi:hypothetical protein